MGDEEVAREALGHALDQAIASGMVEVLDEIGVPGLRTASSLR